MSHLVIFKNAKNATAFHQAPSLEEAVRFVEHLRNTEQVEHTKIFKLHEVNFEFRPYFKVEVGQAGGPSPAEPESSGRTYQATPTRRPP